MPPTLPHPRFHPLTPDAESSFLSRLHGEGSFSKVIHGLYLQGARWNAGKEGGRYMFRVLEKLFCRVN